jgi:hypothetical protein
MKAGATRRGGLRPSSCIEGLLGARRVVVASAGI